MGWLKRFFRKRKLDAQLDAELRFHVEQETAKNIAAGMPPAEARRHALAQFGGLEFIKEETRDARGTQFIESLLQDIRFALRMLRKSPGFTAVAILTLALGIGANTAIFSAISAILLRKPPVKDPDTLCAVASADQASADGLVWVSAPDFLSWQIQNHVFEAMTADESGRSFTLTGKNGPQEVDGDRVTPDYFRIIGFAPFLGRTFLPVESQAGNDHVVILSYSLWRERYNADPNIIGKHLDVDTVPYTIVGVMPQGAALPLPQLPPSLWMPLVFGSDDLTSGARSNHYLNIVIARLKPGVTVRQAQADMDSVAERLAAEYPSTNVHWGVTVLTLQEYRIRWAQIRPFMMVLFTVVGFVLLIACANIAGLLLSRGAMRAHEMAVRAAIGAGRARLVRQLLTESFLIGFAGGAGGLILSVGGIRFLRAGFFNLYGGQGAPSLHLDQRTLLFTLVVALLSVILFGLVPAFQSSNVDPGHALSESGRTGSSSFARSHLRSVLVTGEIALSVVLLAGAGVALDQLVQHFSAPLGFNPHHLVAASLHLDSPRYRNAAARTAFFEQVTGRLRSISGVKSSALDNCLPFDCGYGTSFAVVGKAPVTRIANAVGGVRRGRTRLFCDDANSIS